MKKLSIFYMLLILCGCSSSIKNQNTEVVVEEGVDTATMINEETLKAEPPKEVEKVVEVIDSVSYPKVNTKDPLGYWVGYFEQDQKRSGESQYVSITDVHGWNKENKINISVDQIRDTVVTGHSVVAGNDRPFSGTVAREVDAKGDTSYHFSVAEPGDDRYDGQFEFTIAGGKMTGIWTAYKNVNIKYRKYTLDKKAFVYDPHIMLEVNRDFVDWTKTIEHEVEAEYDEGEFERWIETEYATATYRIYEINASNTLLKRSDVSNLRRGDLVIIRNTIYARHGYSFRNQPLRIFFDAQEWYIPVHADIRSDFTAIELENIKLLLSFEKNAAEYYDSFGRG